MNPLVMFTIAVILVATPLSIAATRFMWRLYREDRRTGDSARVTLSFVLAAVTTTTAVAGLLLAIPTALLFIGANEVIHQIGGHLVLVAIDILLPAPVAIAAYLRWLRGKAAQ